MSNPNKQDSAPSPTAVIDAPTDVQDTPPSISAKLFPDFKQGPEESETETPETPATEPVVDPGTEAPPIVEEPAPAQEPPAPAPSDLIDISAFQGKKVRVKVDGEEMEVPAESLLKNFQLEAHLTRKGQQIGEQRRALDELRKELLGKTQEQTTDIETAIDDGETPDEIKLLKTQLELTQRQLAQISAATSDIVFEKNVSQLDQHVKANLGFEDFREYVPKIQSFIKTQLVDPSKPSPQELAMFDSPAFYLSKFQEMKLKDLQQALKKPAAAPAPVPQAQPPAPKVTKIINVETPGGAVPEKLDEAKERNLQAAFANAKKIGTTEAWAEYYALKRSS